MASIRKVGDKWRVQIRRAGAKSISKMCATKAEATRWAREQEAKIDAGGMTGPSTMTVKELIAEYRKMREKSGREVSDSSSEHYMLACLDRLLGARRVDRLEVSHLVEFAQVRKAEGAGAYTINMDVSKLGTVLRHAGAVLGLRISDVVGQARPVLHHLKLIGGGGKRDRRPTDDELLRIIAWLEAQPSATMRRMPDVILLSALIGLRRGEAFRIAWGDLDAERRVILVRDRKDPRNKAGNDQEVPLIGDALEIIQRQPREHGEDRIFPFHPQTVSKYFKLACDKLSIPDLHWHDLRHEAASALAEAGWSPHEIKAVTGHRKDEHLDRYVNMDPTTVARKPIGRPRKHEAGDSES